MIHICTPFALDKNLGREYNMAFGSAADWVCLIDRDVMFLTPNSIPLMYKYIKIVPDAGILTCYTNRIHNLAHDQLFFTLPSDDFNVLNWEREARKLEQKQPSVSEIDHVISGFLMLISKKVWNELGGFDETFGSCLGVDNQFSSKVLNSGKKIYRMNTLLVWHSYRMENIRDKSHLT